MDWPRRQALIDEVERSGLTGRGGAAFPTARKLAAVAARRRPRGRGQRHGGRARERQGQGPAGPVAASGPRRRGAGRRDHRGQPGRDRRAHRPSARSSTRPRPSAGAAGIDQVRIDVVTGADRFVGGEASAVVHWIEKGVPTPTRTPPRLSERGLGGQPTLVQNVETLAHLALIARYGAAWFRGVGTAAEPGSMLVTVLGAVNEPCVHEIAIGIPVGEVLRAGGRRVRAAAGPAAWRLLRELGRCRGGGAAALLRRGAGPAGRRDQRRPDRGPPGRHLRARRDGPGGAVSRRRVRGPVRTLPVRPGRGGRGGPAPRRRPHVQPGYPAAAGSARWTGGVPATTPTAPCG